MFTPLAQKPQLISLLITIHFVTQQILLSLFSALGGAAALLLLLVPVGRVTVFFPDNVVLAASCAGGGLGANHGDLLYTINQEHPCDTLLDTRINATVQSCG